MKHRITISFLLLATLLFSCKQDDSKKIYETKPSEERPVYDYANILSESEVAALENKLGNFYRATSTQIVIVTLNDLKGDDIQHVATEIGDRWGVGQAKEDNGIVVVVKPKTEDEKGEAFIATGYGMEGDIPDLLAKEIVDNAMIPSFKEGKYFAGLDSATNTMIQLTNGDYTEEELRKLYDSQKKKGVNPIGIIIPIVVFLLIFGGIFGRASRMRRGSIGRSIPFFILLSMMGGGSRHGGSFGNFSSGGGGFGGFGGGGFGGGGAGGSW